MKCLHPKQKAYCGYTHQCHCKRCIRGYKLYKAKNKERIRAYHKKVKSKVFLVYSKGRLVCKCCGETNISFLTLDHVYNDGAKERKLKNRRGINFYFYLLKKNFPRKDRYQILCMNCQLGKFSNGGLCPHAK